MGKYLYSDPEVFSNVTIDTLHRYNQHHASLAEDDFTAVCYATMTPREELIKIMEQVDRVHVSMDALDYHWYSW